MKKFLTFIFVITIALLPNRGEKQIDVFNSLKFPIYLNNQPSKNRGEIPQNDKSGNFSITGWFKINDFTVKYLNILKVFNEVKKKEKKNYLYNSLYPICPYSLNFLEKYPQYKTEYNIKNNPNCFFSESEIKNETPSGSFVEEIDSVCSIDVSKTDVVYTLKFDFPTTIENSNTVLFNKGSLEDFLVKPDIWIFFAISFDYPDNKGVALIKSFEEDSEYPVSEKKFVLNLPGFFLHKNYLVYYSENTEIKSFDNMGLIYDVNFYYDFFSDLALFSLFNFDDKILKMNNLKLEFNFEDTRTNRNVVFSKGDEYNIKGNFTVDKYGVLFQDHSFINLKKIFADLPDTLIKSPTFYFTFKVFDKNYHNINNAADNKEKKDDGNKENIDNKKDIDKDKTDEINIENFNKVKKFKNKQIIEEKNIEKVDDKKSTQNIEMENKIILLSTVDDNFVIYIVKKDNKVSIGLEYKKNDLRFYYESKKNYEFTETIELIVSINFSNTNFEFYIFQNDNTFEKSPKYKINIEEIINSDFNLLSERNSNFSIELFRYLILENPLPFIIKNQKSLEKYELSCNVFLIPNISDNNICLNCENSVLNSSKTCQKFCKLGEKNVNGVCQNCFLTSCDEILKPTLIIKESSDKVFNLQLNEDLFENNLKNLKDKLKINFSPFLNKTHYNYTFEAINENELSLKFQSKKNLFNSTLTIILEKDDLQNLYSKNREKIEKFEASVTIKNISEFNETSQSYLKFFAYTLITIFWLMIIFGIFIFFLKFKYDLNDYSFKKMFFIFINIQMFILLVFLGIKLPRNLHFVINKTFDYTFNFFGFHNFFLKVTKIIPKDHIVNFDNSSISYLFIDNLGSLLIFHIFFILFYLVSKILVLFNKASSFLSPTVRERLYTINEVFEYNVIMVAFTVFSIPIFSFSILNLIEFNKETFWTTFSLAISFIYIILFILGFIVFSILFMINSGFIQYSSLKTKFDFLFFGYNDQKLSNLYDIIEIILNCIIGIILTGLNSRKDTQVIFLFFLKFLKLLSYSFIKPHLNNWDKYADFMVRLIWIIFFLLISAFSMFDQDNSEKISETIGLFLLIMFLIMVLFEFITNLLFASKFLVNLKKNGGNSPENYQFQKLSNYNNNSLVDMNQSNQSKKNSTKSRDLEEIKKLNDQDKSHFYESQNLNKSIRSNIDKRKNNIELDDLKSGKGSLHDSYISSSGNSHFDKEKDNTNTKF